MACFMNRVRRKAGDTPHLVRSPLRADPRIVDCRLAIAQAVGVVDQHQTIGAQSRRIMENPADGRHFAAPAILAAVFPHLDLVLNDQGAQPVVVLENPGQGRRHEGLPQADHVADRHAAVLYLLR